METHNFDAGTVFERIICHGLTAHLDRKDFPPDNHYAYRSGRGVSDPLVTLDHLQQNSLDQGGEERVLQLNFSVAVDRVNHLGLLLS